MPPFGLEFADAPARRRQLRELRGRDPGTQPTVDQILVAPVVDRLTRHAELFDDLRVRPLFLDQVQNLAPELNRIPLGTMTSSVDVPESQLLDHARPGADRAPRGSAVPTPSVRPDADVVGVHLRDERLSTTPAGASPWRNRLVVVAEARGDPGLQSRRLGARRARIGHRRRAEGSFAAPQCSEPFRCWERNRVDSQSASGVHQPTVWEDAWEISSLQSSNYALTRGFVLPSIPPSSTSCYLRSSPFSHVRSVCSGLACQPRCRGRRRLAAERIRALAGIGPVAPARRWQAGLCGDCAGLSIEARWWAGSHPTVANRDRRPDTSRSKQWKPRFHRRRRGRWDPQ